MRYALLDAMPMMVPMYWHEEMMGRYGHGQDSEATTSAAMRPRPLSMMVHMHMHMPVHMPH